MSNGVAFRGFRTDERTTRMVEAAEAVLGGKLTITQGSYNHGGVSASAGTHDGGGCLDFSVRGLTLSQINLRVRALRLVGFAAWHRLPSEGPWREHIHGVAVGCPDLAPVAARQVTALRNGRNGLASNGPDRHRGLGLPVITFEQYLKQGKPPVKKPPPKPPAAGAFPGVDAFRIGRANPAVTVLGKRLVALGFTWHNDGNGYQPGPTFTAHDMANLADFQRSRPELAGDPDGLPGPKTWAALFPKSK